MANTKKGIPTFLLSHDPTHWYHKVLSHPQPIDLQMAGHTHGMQFGIEVGQFRWSLPSGDTSIGLVCIKREVRIYMSTEASATLATPGRVGILPEITIIDVQST